MPIPSEKLEKFVAWPGIEPGSPANMASALTTELPNYSSLPSFFSTFFIDADVILEHFYTNSLLVIPAENQTLNKSYAGVGEQDLFL